MQGITEITASTIILEEAERLIREVGWTRYTPARDAAGHIVNECNPRAACFCVWGAITRAYFNLNPRFDTYGFSGYSAALRVTNDLIYAVSGIISFGKWNDDRDRTREQVIDLLHQAAEVARGQA